MESRRRLELFKSFLTSHSGEVESKPTWQRKGACVCARGEHIVMAPTLKQPNACADSLQGLSGRQSTRAC